MNQIVRNALRCDLWVTPGIVPGRQDGVLWASNICDVCIICIANFYPFLPNVSLPLSHDIPGPRLLAAFSRDLCPMSDLSPVFTALISRQFPRSARMAAPNELCRWGPNYGPGSPSATRQCRASGENKKCWENYPGKTCLRCSNLFSCILYMYVFSSMLFIIHSFYQYIRWKRHLVDYIKPHIAPRT